MTQPVDSRLWHPFAQMQAVASRELVLERGEDVWVWDTRGKRYLDATASLWYANVGHGRREIAEAVAAQLAKLEAYSAFGDFATRPAVELAERLAEYAPLEGGRVFFGSGGGDGIDTAAKIARRFWQERGESERTHLIARRHGYHGTHGYGTSLGGIEANRGGWGPLDREVSIVDYDSVEALRAEIDRLTPERVAAVFVEPVIGAGGVLPPPDGYLEGVAELCTQTGILFVCDSVICGFGRLGTWFGIERWDVAPDMIVFAKGVTSGYLPLGGVIVNARVSAPFWYGWGTAVLRHGPTYSAHATCCAAALANLDLLADGLLERGKTMEGPLLDALAPLAEHPLVGEVRGGIGLLAAIQIDKALLEVHPNAVFDVVAHARQAGVILRPLLGCIAISPPLTATEEHFARIAEVLHAALEGVGVPAGAT